MENTAGKSQAVKRYRTKLWTEKEGEFLLFLGRMGIGPTQISREFFPGRTPQQIADRQRYERKVRGIYKKEVRRKQPQGGVRRALIREQDAGLSVKEIAEKHGYSHKSMRSWLPAWRREIEAKDNAS